MKLRSAIYSQLVLCILVLTAFAACSDEALQLPDAPQPPGATAAQIIQMGGIDNAQLQMMLDGTVTRAANGSELKDAETVDWLLDPLFNGLDITYGEEEDPDNTKRVALLRLLKKDPKGGNTKDNIKYSEGNIAEYSFKYRNQDGVEGDDARWYDNGDHFFQGVFVPEQLRYQAQSQTPDTVNDPTSGKAPSLTTDQSKDNTTDNYTLLSRYLGMPADARLHATVGRIKLPFRHRLARVLAYVLIDPEMGSDVKIQGYKMGEGNTPVETEDPTNSDIRFCNVKVLSAVKETDNAGGIIGHAELTPQWTRARKAIPHFVGELGSMDTLGTTQLNPDFIMYYRNATKTYIFPANTDAWNTAGTAWNAKYDAAKAALPDNVTDDAQKEKWYRQYADSLSGYKRTLYGKVPCYDLIVRPTYTSSNMVMYDEDLGSKTKAAFATESNSIDFEITLNNGLQYTKHFVFDLDANYQTVVYLRISREHVDYNASGAELWDEETHYDGFYGVNNRHGNTLSYAGSSWQRAYRVKAVNYPITDGHYYEKPDGTDSPLGDESDENSLYYQQYVTQAQWLEMFAQAHEGGLHHGDYFILDADITIDARSLPDDFVFTGHLDGQDHVITVTNVGEEWTEYQPTTDYALSELYVDNGAGGKVQFALPQLYTKVEHPNVEWDADDLILIDEKRYVKTTLIYHEAVDAVLYTEETAAAENAKHLVEDEAGKKPGEEGYVPTYEDDYQPVTAGEEMTPAQEAYYEVTEGSKTTSDAGYEYQKYAYTEYLPAKKVSIVDAMTADPGTYFIKSEGEGQYTPYDEVRPAQLFEAIPHTSGAALFAGLNGAYAAAMGEANVHEETYSSGNTFMVPYVDADGGTGWRAEVINTCIKGGDMFPTSVIDESGQYLVSAVSGYVYNCWRVGDDNKPTTAILSHTPALPKYKE